MSQVAQLTGVPRGLVPDDPRHGTRNGYINHGCRCAACRAAQAAYQRGYNHRTGRVQPFAAYRVTVEAAMAARHGTEGTARRCKCAACVAAASAARRLRRHANPDAANGYARERRARITAAAVASADARRVRRARELARLRVELTGELGELLAAQLRDERRVRVQSAWAVSMDAQRYANGETWHDSLTFGGQHLRAYESDAWTDAVIARVDQRRQIDEWAAA